MCLLRDANENYRAWLEAIRTAESRIHFENYIIHSDDVGRQFGEALSDRARQGVRVRLIYDWLGALGATSYRFGEHDIRHAGQIGGSPSRHPCGSDTGRLTTLRYLMKLSKLPSI